MPLNGHIDGQIGPDKHKYKENKYLTEYQARHIYKKVESGNTIDINTLKQEVDEAWESVCMCIYMYVYAIGLGLRPSYIFPLTKTAYKMGK